MVKYSANSSLDFIGLDRVEKIILYSSTRYQKPVMNRKEAIIQEQFWMSPLHSSIESRTITANLTVETLWYVNKKDAILENE